MSGYYETLYGGACNGDRVAQVRLYANDGAIRSDVENGSNIATALDSTFSTLMDENQISGYEISRFESERDGLYYPRADVSDDDGDGYYTDDVVDQFNTFLKNGGENGTGFNLKNKIGVHLIVHDDGCAQTKAGGEGIGTTTCDDDRSYIDKRDRRTAFSTAAAMVTCICPDDSLVRASAIQETLHPFIRDEQPNVKDMWGTEDEHSLGWIDLNGYLSPMLTYHVDDNEPSGDCQRSSDSYSSYTQTMTTCSKDAVGYTADKQCVDNNPTCSN